jgi:metal-dependent hydrolase (beta-lactamase superfamily II)
VVCHHRGICKVITAGINAVNLAHGWTLRKSSIEELEQHQREIENGINEILARHCSDFETGTPTLAMKDGQP